VIPLKLWLKSTLTILLIALVTICSLPIKAQEKTTLQFRDWDVRLSTIEGRVQTKRAGDLEIRNFRIDIDEIIGSASKIQAQFSGRSKQIKNLISTLKPASEKEGVPETEEVKRKFRALVNELASLQGQARQAELIVTKSKQVLSELARSSRARLKATLFERGISPLNYNAWVRALDEYWQIATAPFDDEFKSWWQEIVQNKESRNALLRAILIALLVAAAAYPLSRKMRTLYGRVQDINEPTYIRRLLAGVVEGGGRTLAPIVFVLLAGFLLINGDLITGTVASEVKNVMRSLVLLLFGSALVAAAFTPRRPNWRLMDFGAEATGLLVRRLRIALFAFIVLNGARLSFWSSTLSSEAENVSAFIFTLILVPALFSLLDIRIWQYAHPIDERHSKERLRSFPRLRALLALILMIIPIIALIGYTRLPIYLLNATVLSGLLIGSLALLRAIGREGLTFLLDSRLPIGRYIREGLAFDEDLSETALFWLRITLDITLVVLAVAVLLPVWGLGTDDTFASVATILTGVKIGSYTFSLFDILIGFGVFFILVIFTRFIQRELDKHILPNLTKDQGVRDALKTGVGYLGFVLAGLIGISALGLDLSNLALIAGALSVGLGFGLQNIVSNFVSGLILLVERPIKQGDWIVIGGHEGTVKNVSVRATEIETFQRASVIIPNADLISSPVINWTHKNILGRVEIKIGVSYDTSPNRIEEILLGCAQNHPNVQKWPEPVVLFADFGQSSLDFELRAYLANVEGRLKTASELRFAIFEALKVNNIEIPFPHRVIHIAASDEIKSD
jgi:potassium efflux system protein